MRRLPILALTAVVVVALARAVPAVAALPGVRHVFIVVLENKDYEESFGEHTQAPYLARELAGMGQILTSYYGTSHVSLGNYLSMISGQGANPATQSDCQTFTDFVPGTRGPDGQALGVGCVYPTWVRTLPDQLEAAGLMWKGYMQDMGTPCRHPAVGALDTTQLARVGDQYATRHNPFVYFHSIIDDRARCHAHVVGLERLPEDLQRAATTPNLVFITPNLCDDGHDAPCIDGRPGGLVSADRFLRAWAPRILASPAFRRDGLLIVTWDEANVGPATAGACCAEIALNTPAPGIFGPGGGRTGTVLVSPFIAPNGVNTTPYNHYALLRSIEDLFGLGHLGYAARPELKAFGDDVFTRPSGPAPNCRTRLVVQRRRDGRARLLVRSPRGGIATVRSADRSTTRRLRPCRAVHVALPGRHGRARVSLTGRRTRDVRW